MTKQTLIKMRAYYEKKGDKVQLEKVNKALARFETAEPEVKPKGAK
jgi:hypothetical protein